MLCYFPTGIYWIDPDLGCESDAFQVYCNFSKKEEAKSCLIPPDSTIVSTASNRENGKRR